MSNYRHRAGTKCRLHIVSNYRHRAGTKGTHYAGYILCLTIDLGLVPKVHTMQATH